MAVQKGSYDRPRMSLMACSPGWWMHRTQAASRSVFW